MLPPHIKESSHRKPPERSNEAPFHELQNYIQKKKAPTTPNQTIQGCQLPFPFPLCSLRLSLPTPFLKHRACEEEKKEVLRGRHQTLQCSKSLGDIFLKQANAAVPRSLKAKRSYIKARLSRLKTGSNRQQTNKSYEQPQRTKEAGECNVRTTTPKSNSTRRKDRSTERNVHLRLTAAPSHKTSPKAKGTYRKTPNPPKKAKQRPTAQKRTHHKQSTFASSSVHLLKHRNMKTKHIGTENRSTPFRPWTPHPAAERGGEGSLRSKLTSNAPSGKKKPRARAPCAQTPRSQHPRPGRRQTNLAPSIGEDNAPIPSPGAATEAKQTRRQFYNNFFALSRSTHGGSHGMPRRRPMNAKAVFPVKSQPDAAAIPLATLDGAR